MEPDPSGTYRNVRALERGLRLLELLGERGWCAPGALARASGIDRSSVYRLLNTLTELGFVVRRREDGMVNLTPRLGHIAEGVKNDDLHAQIAAPFLRKLTAEVLWPSDFASLSLGKVVIRFSTHKISPMTIYRSVIGESRGLLRSALGKAIFSAMTEQELEAARTTIYDLGGPDHEDMRNDQLLRAVIEKTRRDGYASSIGETNSKISAIALPVFGPSGSGIGAINLIYFTSAMSATQAAERYLPALRSCTSAVEKALQAEAES